MLSFLCDANAMQKQNMKTTNNIYIFANPLRMIWVAITSPSFDFCCAHLTSRAHRLYRHDSIHLFIFICEPVRFLIARENTAEKNEVVSISALTWTHTHTMTICLARAHASGTGNRSHFLWRVAVFVRFYTSSFHGRILVSNAGDFQLQCKREMIIFELSALQLAFCIGFEW